MIVRDLLLRHAEAEGKAEYSYRRQDLPHRLTAPSTNETAAHVVSHFKYILVLDSDHSCRHSPRRRLAMSSHRPSRLILAVNDLE